MPADQENFLSLAAQEEFERTDSKLPFLIKFYQHEFLSANQ